MRKLLLSLAFAVSTNSACIIKDGLRSDVCSYDPIEESQEEKSARLCDVQCKEVIPDHNNSLEDRINIVFIGVNYSPEQFLANVRNSTDCTRENSGILSHEIFSNNMDLFNFWYFPEVQDYTYYNGRYYDESDSILFGLSGAGSRLAQECNGNNTQLHNIVPIVLAPGNFRSHASFPPLMGYNIEGVNYSNLINLKEKLIHENIDSGMCRSFVNTCSMLDTNSDGRFTDDEINSLKVYSEEDLQNMCLAVSTSDQCQQMNWREITHDYRLAEHAYGFQLCKTLSEISLESTVNPSDELCDVMLNSQPRLGVAVVYSKRAVPRVVCHELGHSIAALRDEYVENSKGNFSVFRNELEDNGINCFIGTYDECMQNSNWSHLENTGCFEGCDYTQYGVYRSIDNGIMRDSSAESFGAYNEERFCMMFKLYTGNAYGICQNYLKK